MVFRSVQADVELLRDLEVRTAFRHEPRNLSLSLGNLG